MTSTGFCYSNDSSSGNGNMQVQIVNHQMQGFEHNPEMYSLTTGIDMIGFPSKNLNPETLSVHWKSHGRASSSKAMNDHISSGFYQQGFTDTSMASADSYRHHQSGSVLVDDATLRGLSLSLNSSDRSSIGYQSFQLRQEEGLRFGPSSSRPVNTPQMMLHGQFYVRNSKFLDPAQELLNEFCSIGMKKTDGKYQQKSKTTSECQDDDDAVIKQSLSSLDLLGLQKRRTKLLQLLEEVERRYRIYCEQMKVVVSSFEEVAGTGAADVYSALASRAMSKHFRCLKDEILRQIKATKSAMGEKDNGSPGATKGETPRLRILDQAIRQQRAFQQMNIMESHPWRPQRGLPERSVSILRAWLFEHFLHPYPNDVDKLTLARQTGLSRSQVSNWFINARVRLWKPMVEEMYLEELKDQEGTGGGASDGAAANLAETEISPPPKTQNLSRNEDQKPTQDQLFRIQTDCLSSIINGSTQQNDDTNYKKSQSEQRHLSFGRVGDSYTATKSDFSAYPPPRAVAGGSAALSYCNENHGVQSSGGGGVSLTLGLQQLGGSNGVVTVAFSPTSQSSLFYQRFNMEDCPTVQYSLLDGENQALPYRNAQLLHDLAG